MVGRAVGPAGSSCCRCCCCCSGGRLWVSRAADVQQLVQLVGCATALDGLGQGSGGGAGGGGAAPGGCSDRAGGSGASSSCRAVAPCTRGGRFRSCSHIPTAAAAITRPPHTRRPPPLVAASAAAAIPAASTAIGPATTATTLAVFRPTCLVRSRRCGSCCSSSGCWCVCRFVHGCGRCWVLRVPLGRPVGPVGGRPTAVCCPCPEPGPLQVLSCP